VRGSSDPLPPKAAKKRAGRKAGTALARVLEQYLLAFFYSQ